jgi:hypothetical protein
MYNVYAQIKDLPQFYSPQQNPEPFCSRMQRWRAMREEEVGQRKELAEDAEAVECTFHPAINRNSRRAVRAIRGGDETDANERLYRQVERIKEVQRR